MLKLIVSQGRIADRTPGAIAGARLTADALSQDLGLSPRVIGTPSAAHVDNWTESLPGARKTLDDLSEAVGTVLAHGDVPLVAANTCSASIATLPLLQHAHPDAAILWFDAHGDYNTPATTESGYLGGMVLAGVCGLWDTGHGGAVNPRQIIIAGGRDIDAEEAKLLAQSGVTVLPPASSTPEHLASLVGTRPVWVHIDWDVLEPGCVPAAYAVPNGLTPQSIAAVLAALPPQQIAGIELAEFEADTSNTHSNNLALMNIQSAVQPTLTRLQASLQRPK